MTKYLYPLAFAALTFISALIAIAEGGTVELLVPVAEISALVIVLTLGRMGIEYIYDQLKF